jgi:hypothetical protein
MPHYLVPEVDDASAVESDDAEGEAEPVEAVALAGSEMRDCHPVFEPRWGWAGFSGSASQQSCRIIGGLCRPTVQNQRRDLSRVHLARCGVDVVGRSGWERHYGHETVGEVGLC